MPFHAAETDRPGSRTVVVAAFRSPVPYRDAAALQEALVEARFRDEIPDVVLLLEHPPVVTLGRRSRTGHLLLSPAEYARRGIDVVESSRGGDVTYHGPGQLVLYPILRLGTAGADAMGYLHNLEEVAMRTAGDFGVAAFRRPGMTGAWTAQGKIAAIGVRLRRWISHHGMSFNAANDLDGFRTIVPCGLAGEPVASLAEILGPACPPLERVRERMLANFSEVLQRGLCPWNDGTKGYPALAAIVSGASPHAPTD